METRSTYRSFMSAITFLGFATVCSPVVLVGLMGSFSLCGWAAGERLLTRLSQLAIAAGLLSAAGILVSMLVGGSRHVVIDAGNWVHIPHFHLALKFVFDRLSVPFVILTFVLGGTIVAFAQKYLHREPGFNRFFFLFSLFLLGMTCASLAGTIETLFVGWELVGLSSALLVAFFHERPAPVQNGLWVWSVYRASDAALMLAALLLHHMTGEGDFDGLMGVAPWPLGTVTVAEGEALAVGLLLLIAAAGKSALVPFSGWLPRAMEGPTPSSAVFYGALSVHLGAFLLLRASPLLDRSAILSAAVIVGGLLTALLATLAGRAQSDVKSVLSFACLTQVGIIVTEIGFGLRYIPLVHILGHACLRTLQFVRAPSLLQDYRVLENAIGSHLPRAGGQPAAAVPGPGHWLYRFALERGYLDAVLADFVVRPILRFFQWCDAREQQCLDRLDGPARREGDSQAASFVGEEAL